MNKKPKILIVEDERIIALETRRKLESMGYDVPAMVSSGEEAIIKSEELHPDLVLMDIVLKGEMDGVEAAGQIHSRFGIPVVYITANVSDARLEDITRSEPFGCLFKPFEDMELQAAVKMALYKYEMEKKLRDSEENYRSVVDNSHDGILIVGEDYRFAYVNDMFCQIIGYPHSEIIGQDFTKFIDEEGKKLVADGYKQRQAGEKLPPRYEFNIVRKDGTKRRVEISSTVSRDSKGRVRTIAQILDITERKQAERALHDSEKKYRTLAETTSDITFVLDLDGKFTYISPVIEKLTGYSWQELIGHSFTEIIAPEYVKSTVEHFKEGIAGGDSPLYEIEVRHKDGGTIPTELNVSSLTDATGKTTGRIGVARDITDRKLAEEETKAHQEHLALINQILRHDLTNNLVVIQSALNLYNKSPEEEFLKEISSHTKESLALINRMRELEFFISRHSNLKPYKINDAIDEVIKNYPFIDFKVKGKAQVMADDSLSSVIDNIVRNAVIHGKAGRITITTGRERDMCEVRIADNGSGITDEIKAKVFEEGFMHGDTGHTGLGLHIVQKAMESYGGYAYVEDNEPKGAVFVLRFRMVE